MKFGHLEGEQHNPDPKSQNHHDVFINHLLHPGMIPPTAFLHDRFSTTLPHLRPCNLGLMMERKQLLPEIPKIFFGWEELNLDDLFLGGQKKLV